jgi:Superinfection immunity protein
MNNVVMIRLVAAVMVFVVLLPLYFLPTLIVRGKLNAKALFWLNLLAGWTFIGWFAALVWAITNDSQSVVVEQQPLPQAVFCSTCRKYSAAGARFCSTCGSSFAAATQQAASLP